MKKLITILFATAFLLTGCGSSVSEPEDENIAYSPIVCSYSNMPSYGTVIDFITTNIVVYDNNTVEVYCGDFSDTTVGEEGIELDYIYGETFEITQEEKENIIEAIKRNRIAKLSDCDSQSDDGSYSYIYLYDENGERIHSCGGLNPEKKRFQDMKSAIRELLPEDVIPAVRQKATEELAEYLLENYPEEYNWLEGRY